MRRRRFSRWNRVFIGNVRIKIGQGGADARTFHDRDHGTAVLASIPARRRGGGVLPESIEVAPRPRLGPKGEGSGRERVVPQLFVTRRLQNVGSKSWGKISIKELQVDIDGTRVFSPSRYEGTSCRPIHGSEGRHVDPRASSPSSSRWHSRLLRYVAAVRQVSLRPLRDAFGTSAWTC